MKPEEDWLFGVSLHDGTLRFGPAGGAFLWSCVGASVATVIAGVALAGAANGSWIFRVAALAIAVMPVTLCVGRIRSRVTATAAGVSVRSGWRTTHVAWPDVRDLEMIEHEPPATFRPPIRLGSVGAGGVRADVDSTQVFIVRGDGSRVRLHSFDSAVRSTGTSLGIATPTEMKLNALRRYRALIAAGVK